MVGGVVKHIAIPLMVNMYLNLLHSNASVLKKQPGQIGYSQGIITLLLQRTVIYMYRCASSVPKTGSITAPLKDKRTVFTHDSITQF